MELKRMDLYGAGHEQIALEAQGRRVVLAPEKGGRIIELSYEGVNAFHSLYPKGFAFGPYTEYGGMEEHVGSAPGTVWNVPWECEIQDQSVVLSAYSEKTLIRKRLTLEEDPPILRIEYELANYGPNYARFTFGIHPEISLGGNHREARYHVPVEGRVESGGYSKPGFRKYVIQQEGWSAATLDGRVYAQILPPGVADCLEIYYPQVDTHLVLQPVVFGAGLSPEMRVRFPFLIYYGPGDENTAKELYDFCLPELAVGYLAAEPRPGTPEPPRRERRNGADFGFDREIERTLRREGPGPGFDFGRQAERERRQEERERRREERFRREAKPPAPPVPPAPHIPAVEAVPPFVREQDVHERRMAILQRVAEGECSVDEAVRLIEELDQERGRFR